MPTKEGTKIGHRPKGKRNAPQMRGQGGGKEVLGPADNAVIVSELRRFTPLCMIAAKLNVARHTLEKYVHTTPELQQELEDRDESMVDLTEQSLFQASLGKVVRDEKGRPMPINVNAATFLLERKGKQRGYSQHVEVSAEEVPSFTFSRRTSAVKAEPPKQ